MKREDITRILEGLELTDAQVKALLDTNSADITKALGKQKDELTAATESLNKANETIRALEANKGDVDALQKQIEAYKAADAEREAKAKADAERAELQQRMEAVLGDRKFAHPRLQDAVMDDFKAAIHDKANLGKGDKDIFDAITKDQGYFAPQAQLVPNQPGMGGTEPVKITDRNAFFKLTFAEQAKFKEEHAAEFKQLFYPDPNK